MKLTITGYSTGDGSLLSDMARARTVKVLAHRILDKKARFMPRDFIIYDGDKRHTLIDDGKVNARAEEYVNGMRSVPFEAENDGVTVVANYGLFELLIWIDGKAGAQA